jgi:hypothetical protein
MRVLDHRSAGFIVQAISALYEELKLTRRRLSCFLHTPSDVSTLQKLLRRSKIRKGSVDQRIWRTMKSQSSLNGAFIATSTIPSDFSPVQCPSKSGKVNGNRHFCRSMSSSRKAHSTAPSLPGPRRFAPLMVASLIAVRF